MRSIFAFLFLSLLLISSPLAFAVDTVEIRGAVAGTINGVSNLFDNMFIWNPQTFPAFFYDPDKDLGTESLRLTLTGVNKLSGDRPYGIIYATTAKSKDFEHSLWGSYLVMAFLREEYFSGYNNPDLIDAGSEIIQDANSTNLLIFGELVKVLIDDGQEKVIDMGSTLALAEGYSLKPALGIDKRGLLVELTNNGKLVDREALILPGTYVFLAKIGNATGFPVIAAHFQEPIILGGKVYCRVDGLWQISQKPVYAKEGSSYGIMTINDINPEMNTIFMANKDKAITLERNKTALIMPGISIKTADNDSLRFYLLGDIEHPASEGRI